MKNTNLSLDSTIKSLRSVVQRVARYKALLFFLIVSLLYGFIIWRINAFSNVPPGQPDAAVTTSQTTAQPHIDTQVIEKIKSLQDNSVSVQSLFDQARQNPFQE